MSVRGDSFPQNQGTVYYITLVTIIFVENTLNHDFKSIVGISLFQLLKKQTVPRCPGED